MTRGLFIRQIFVLVDLGLAVLAVFMLGAVVLKVLEPAPKVNALEADGTGEVPGEMTPGLRVAARADYNSIKDNGLFGGAGAFDPALVVEEPEPVIEDVPIEETSLNLQLVGTTASYPTDPLASAIIRNNDQRGQSGTYFLNEAVLPDEGRGTVKLVEVYPRWVYILNETKSPAVKEKLSMGDADGAVVASSPAPAQAPGNTSGVEQVSINREEFTRELYENYATLVTQIRPQYYRDENGNVVGLTADNIGQIPLAKKLSLTDGDVLQSLNNERIDSEQKVMELFQKYRNSNSFRIGILRGGRPQVITYRLE
jgi:type II secretory pathway component PulC